jgi:SAM-dependent methyltransferase
LSANADQFTYWNEQTGTAWIELEEHTDTLTRPFGQVAMAALEIEAGDSLLDVGCGCGDTTIDLARGAGSGGHVLGVDLSAPMLERARLRAAQAGVGSVEFRQADAQTDTLPDRLDGLYSRFGVMFFDDAPAAFANMAGALRPGGRLSFVCWQGIHRNPWMSVPVGAAERHLGQVALPKDDVPGPFGLADPDRARALLDGAGLVDVRVEPVELDITLPGGDVQGVAAVMLALLPTRHLVRNATHEAQALARDAVEAALGDYRSGESVRVPGAAWVLTGHSAQ